MGTDKEILQYTFIAIALIIAVVLVILLVRVLGKRVNVAKEKKKIAAIIKRYALLHNYQLLNDVTLKSSEKTAHIDHMLIGFFGILFVSDLTDQGEYYGTVGDKTWTVTSDSSKKTIPNHILRNTENMVVVREIFSKHKIYNVRMEGICVLTGRPKRILNCIKTNGEIIFKSALKNLLGKARFDKDADVDVAVLAKIISDNNQA